MTDINETIQEPIEQAGKSTINSMVALMVAITATFMALCNVKDGNIVQAMSQAQANTLMPGRISRRKVQNNPLPKIHWN
jgi:hypothetical protein